MTQPTVSEQRHHENTLERNVFRGPLEATSMAESPDPTVVSVVVVRAEDVVTALETNVTSGEHAVVRLTPPFSGRMRARLHVERGAYDETPRPVHIDPETVLDDPPPYPRPPTLKSSSGQTRTERTRSTLIASTTHSAWLTGVRRFHPVFATGPRFQHLTARTRSLS
ncbi:hypothetical protein [Halovenus marina]|uniref:hypothetical protein n=1 Tax=Halovenus marina TaxID=3396621 RepID=UPI003F56A044